MTGALSTVVILVSGLLGLAVGSFLNVVVWRVPRGESIHRPASACPRCGHAIRWRDNIPVLSWILLRGKCRDCGQPVSARYPIVELVTAIVFAAVAARFLAPSTAIWAIPAFLYLAAIGIALSLIDIDTHRLPNQIVLPSYGVGLVALIAASAGSADWSALVRAMAGAAALFIFYLVLALAVPRGMGFGDVKLAGVLGLYLGWLGWGPLVVGAFAPFLLGGVYSVGLLLTRKATRKSGVPFGPWMIIGTGIAVFFGESIADGYLAFVGLK